MDTAFLISSDECITEKSQIKTSLLTLLIFYKIIISTITLIIYLGFDLNDFIKPIQQIHNHLNPDSEIMQHLFCKIESEIPIVH